MIKLNLKTKFNKNGKHEILSKRKKQRNNYILKQKKITLIRWIGSMWPTKRNFGKVLSYNSVGEKMLNYEIN